MPGLPENHVLLVNKNHPLIEGLIKLESGSIITGDNTNTSKGISNDLASHIYDLARLGVGGLEPNELPGFQARSAELMGKLMSKAI